MGYLIIVLLGFLLFTKFNIKISINNTQTKSGENWYVFPTLSMLKLVVLLVFALAFLAPETLPNIINIIHHIPLQ